MVDFNIEGFTLDFINKAKLLKSDIRIIIMSSKLISDDKMKVIKDYIIDFLIKPVDWNYLKQILNMIKNEISEKTKGG